MTTQIKANSLHTKIKPEPDGVGVTSIFQKNVPSKMWSGKKVPILVFPTYEGQPVYCPTTDIPIASTTLDSYELSSTPLTYFDNCQELPTGCHLAVFDFTLSGTTEIITEGECQDQTTSVFPVTLSADLEITLGNHSQTLSGICFSSFEQPFVCQTRGSEKSFLDLVLPFDYEDCNGQNIIFGNSKSSASTLLSSVFNDPITNEIYSKIKNFSQNIGDVDTADLEVLSNMSESLGCQPIDLLNNIPVNLSKVMKVGGTSYSTLFGSEDLFDCYTDFSGELLEVDSFVSAGEKLFYQELGTSDPLQVTHVPYLNTLSSFDGSILSGTDYYQLSALDSDCLTVSENCFFRVVAKENKPNLGTLNTSHLSGTPDPEEWCDILTQQLEYNILENITKSS